MSEREEKTLRAILDKNINHSLRLGEELLKIVKKAPNPTLTLLFHEANISNMDLAYLLCDDKIYLDSKNWFQNMINILEQHYGR